MSKKDNSDIEAKIMVRQWILDQFDEPLERLSVLELYGGMGHMYRAVWRGAGRHLAFDRRENPHPDWLRGDNRVLLPKYAGQGWHIYDCDAYDNPWLVASACCRHAKPGRVGIVATCGIRRGLKNGRTNGYVRKVTGYDGLSDSRLLVRWYDDVIRWIMMDWRRYGIKIQQCRRIKSRNNKAGDVWYYGIVAEKSRVVKKDEILNTCEEQNPHRRKKWQ